MVIQINIQINIQIDIQNVHQSIVPVHLERKRRKKILKGEVQMIKSPKEGILMKRYVPFIYIYVTCISVVTIVSGIF